MYVRVSLACIVLACLNAHAALAAQEPTSTLPGVRKDFPAKSEEKLDRLAPEGAPQEEKAPASAPEEAEKPELQIYNTIILQGLNKVTGKISRLDGPLGTLLRFGNLEILARKCWKSPPEERPENAALLEIMELKPSEPPKNIFLGWMFSSSPGLSGLEHPVYDITVLNCESRDELEPETAPAEEEPAADKEEKKQRDEPSDRPRPPRH